MTGLREQERLAMMPIDYDIATLNPMLAWQASLDRGVPGTNPWLGISELIGGMMEQRAAAQQARAQEKAADQSFWGQIFGGGVNAGTQIGSSYIMADALKSRGGGFDPWFMMSDVNAKEDFEHVDADMILQRVEELTIQRWRYKDDPLAAKHIGPMAQDFEETFGLGSNPRHIDVVDAFGVALAAIQALAKRVRELEGQSHRRTAVAAVGGGH